MSTFTTPLRLEHVKTVPGERQLFKVLDPFVYEIGRKGSGYYVTVPAGFVTDFASVPRVLWSLFPPIGEYGKAAVVHDWLYHYSSGFSKCVADAVFYEAMKALGVSWPRRTAIYLAVVLFGKPSFHCGK